MVLVCHSRGGLVGRQAAYLLKAKTPETTVEVLTFGTPFQGTPLANLHPREFGIAYLLGWEIRRGLPRLDPVTAAFRYLSNARAVPDGIAEMRPGSPSLVLLGQQTGKLDRFQCSAGSYDLDDEGSPRGFGPGASIGSEFKASFGREIFDREDNDLVVAATSAQACENPQPVLYCSHFDYFGQPDVISELKAIWPDRQRRTARRVRISAD